ncbi:MAG: hypothetical protein V8R72_00310 [Clostridia bacterium]
MKSGEWTISDGVESDYCEVVDYIGEYSGHKGKWILWKSKTLHILIEEFRKEYEEVKEDGK